MRPLALTLFSVLVAFAQTQQTSSGINSPNVANVNGSVTIIFYTCVTDFCWLDGPRSTFTSTSTSSTTLPPLAQTVGSSSMLTGTGDLLFQKMASAGTTIGGLTVDLRSVVTTPIVSNSVVTGDLSQFQKVANLSDSHTNSFVLAGTSIGSMTVDLPSVATTLMGSNSVVTGDLSQFQKVANLSDRHTNSFVLAGTSIGSLTVDLPSVATTLMGSNSVVTGDLSQFQKVANLSDRHTNSFVLAGTSIGSLTVDLPSVATTLMGSNSVVTGDLSQFQKVANLSDSHTDRLVLAGIPTGTSIGGLTVDFQSVAQNPVHASSILTGTGDLSPSPGGGRSSRQPCQWFKMGYLLHSGRPYILWSALSALAKHFTIDLYGAGPTATACSARRRKSFPRLREFRRLKRNVNSSR